MANAQNVGVGTNTPASKLDVKGNLTIGNTYSGNAAPSNGAIIQGPVGIGTPSPDGNALLDLTATDKGLLLPRVALVSNSNPISGTKPDGLMVYNTSTTGTYSTPGVYTWSTAANDWVRIITNTTLSGSLQPLTNSAGGGLATFSYNGSAATQIGIANQGVVTGMIANDAVTTSQIAPNTITSADMGPNSVDLSSGVVTNVLPINRGGTNTNSLGSGGSVAYSNGTSYAFSPVGTSGQVLVSGGTGQPTWSNANTTLTKNDITSSTTGVSITNGTGQVVGGSNVSVNVATNSAASQGLVPAGTGNNNKVWGTDGAGNPSWSNVSNAQLANSSITVNTTGGITGGGTVALGGSITITGSGGTITGSGTTNYVPKWTPSGTVLGNSQIFDNGTSIGVGTNAPAAPFHIYGDRYTYYGPNSSWGEYLQVGGNGRVTTGASVAATNGNLHLDAKNGTFATYLNWYSQNNLYLVGQGGNIGVGTAVTNNMLQLRSDNSAQGMQWNTSSYIGANQWGTRLYKTDVGGGIPLRIETQSLNTWYTAMDIDHGQDNAHPSLKTYYNTQLAVSGGNVGVGTTAPTTKLHVNAGALRVGTSSTDPGATDGVLSIGNQSVNYNPTTGNWTTTGTTMVLSALDYSTIGFHDAGSRVDFIRTGGGVMQLGYNGGWGAAAVQVPALAGAGTRMVTADVNGTLGVQSLPGGVLPSGTLGQTLYNNGSTWVNTSNLYNDGAQINLGSFTTADADEWPKVTWLRNTGLGWDEGLIKGSSARGAFGRTGFGVHMDASRHFGFFSSGWNPLLDIEAGTGRVYVRGSMEIGDAGFAYAVPNTCGGNWVSNADMAIYVRDNTGGCGDEAYIAHYARSGESTTLEIGNKNDADDHIALMPSGNVGIGTTAPEWRTHIEGVNTPSLLMRQNGTHSYGIMLGLETYDNGAQSQDGPRIGFHKRGAKTWATGIQNGAGAHGYMVWEDGYNGGWGTTRFEIGTGNNRAVFYKGRASGDWPEADLVLQRNGALTYFPSVSFHNPGQTAPQWLGAYSPERLNAGTCCGGAWANVAALGFQTISDVSMKKDIKPLGEEDYSTSLANIRQINSIRYLYNSEIPTDPEPYSGMIKRTKPHLGFTAQSLPSEVVVEDLTKSSSTNQDGYILGYSLNDMDGLLVAGVKALDANQVKQNSELEALKETVAKQQQQIETLTKLLEQQLQQQKDIQPR
ncbi:MAG: tail fiber domain-containing protein [Chitinophagales bacterium]